MGRDWREVWQVVFPAHAGMNRLAVPSITLCHSVPRTRGDEPTLTLNYYFGIECSPHTRG